MVKRRTRGLIVRVDKNDALNPVARAIASRNLRQAVLDMRIAVFLLDDGADSRSHVLAMSTPVYAVLNTLAAIGETESPDYRMLRSGAKVLLEISERGFRWRRLDAVTVDNALEICERRWLGLPPRSLNEQIARLMTD